MHLGYWVQFLAFAPDSSFLLLQTLRDSGNGLGRWVPVTSAGDLELHSLFGLVAVTKLGSKVVNVNSVLLFLS